MEEDDSFDKFYAKLENIVNFTFDLGRRYLIIREKIQYFSHEGRISSFNHSIEITGGFSFHHIS